MRRTAHDYTDCQPVSFRRPEHLKGGGGWHYGRLLEVKDNGDCVVVDFKGTKHTVPDSDVRDIETITPTGEGRGNGIEGQREARLQVRRNKR